MGEQTSINSRGNLEMGYMVCTVRTYRPKAKGGVSKQGICLGCVTSPDHALSMVNILLVCQGQKISMKSLIIIGRYLTCPNPLCKHYCTNPPYLRKGCTEIRVLTHHVRVLIPWNNIYSTRNIHEMCVMLMQKTVHTIYTHISYRPVLQKL